MWLAHQSGSLQAGYEVTIVDDLSRRKIDIELECDSLTPIRPISTRLRKWQELTGKDIEYAQINVALNYHKLLTLIKEREPMAIVHFAEQRAAPYSMKSSYHKRYTVNNNINATNNVLCAIVESKLDVIWYTWAPWGYMVTARLACRFPKAIYGLK